MIVRLVAVTLRVYVPHLNESRIRITVKLPNPHSLSDELGYPGLIRTGGGQEIFK